LEEFSRAKCLKFHVPEPTVKALNGSWRAVVHDWWYCVISGTFSDHITHANQVPRLTFWLDVVAEWPSHYLRQRGCFRVFVCLFVCLLATLREKTPARICMKCSWKVRNGPVNNWLNFDWFWWRYGSLSGYRDCFFPDSLLLADTESGISRLRCAATLQWWAYALAGIAIATMTSLRHRPLAEVCTVPLLL